MSVKVKENGQITRVAGKIPSSFATYNPQHFELKGANKEMNLSYEVSTKLSNFNNDGTLNPSGNLYSIIGDVESLLASL